jgi:membrane protease YdiL (CAAX protease family)
MIAALGLALALAGVAWFAWPRDRARLSHARWLRRAGIGFLLPTLAALLALGRLDALWTVPPEFAPVVAWLPYAEPLAIAPAVALGLAIGGGLIAARIGWARWRGRPLSYRFVFPAPLAAHDRAQLLPAALVSIWAGVTEEVAFRLGLPLLLTLVTGDAWAAVALATLIFAALHRYQPWWGQLMVLGAGVVLGGLYLITGALWLAIVVHAIMDLLGLVLRPWLAGFNSSIATPT